jgi:hypothetical protein
MEETYDFTSVETATAWCIESYGVDWSTPCLSQYNMVSNDTNPFAVFAFSKYTLRVFVLEFLKERI